MSVIDAGVNILVGLIGILFTAAIIVNLWDPLGVYLNNATVFPIGGLALIIIGFIPLGMSLAVMKKGYDEITQPKQEFGGTNYG